MAKIVADVKKAGMQVVETIGPAPFVEATKPGRKTFTDKFGGENYIKDIDAVRVIWDQSNRGADSFLHSLFSGTVAHTQHIGRIRWTRPGRAASRSACVRRLVRLRESGAR